MNLVAKMTFDTKLSFIFSQGEANPQQIQQLSALLAQINRVYDQNQNSEHTIVGPRES